MRRSRTRWMWLLIAGLLSGWPTGPAGAHEGSGALDGRGGAYKTPPFTEPPSMDTRKPRIRRGPGHEVWRLDQSNTNGLAYGGTLYIYDGRQLRRHAATAVSERMDLGGATAALCLAKTGANPVRPHMLVFNVNDNTHAIVSFVASGHVVFFDAETRTPCADPCATPMRIVAEYDAATLPRDGCGFTEARGWVYGDGGDGNALNPDGWSVYRLPVGSRDVYNAGNPEKHPGPPDDRPRRQCPP